MIFITIIGIISILDNDVAEDERKDDSHTHINDNGNINVNDNTKGKTSQNKAVFC